MEQDERIYLLTAAALVIMAFIWSLGAGAIATDLWSSWNLGGPGTRTAEDAAFNMRMAWMLNDVHVPDRIR